MDSTTIVFVHGLGGDPHNTWGSFPGLIAGDPSLRGFGSVAFSYPTSLFRLPFSRKAPSVLTLADALRTFIKHRCANTDVVLVCHSLGGLIARQYLIDEVRHKAALRARGVMFYACPTTGSALAEVGSLVSWRHNQLRQLCRDSDLVRSVEKDWEAFKLPDCLSVRYVVAGQDRVVTELAARSSWGQSNVEVIADRGHIDIVKPSHAADLPYLVFQKFVVGLPVGRAGIDSATPAGAAASRRAAESAPAPLSRATRSAGERFDLQRFHSSETLGTTDHSRIQKGTYKGKTVVLKRTDEQLCDIDALQAVASLSSGDLTLSGLGTVLLHGPENVWVQNGHVWEVQEFVDGITLGALVNRNVPIFGRFLEDCAEQLFWMLEALEQLEIVHRDITPDNLILTPEGELRLIDWTFCLRPGRAQEIAVVTEGFTAPEQSRGAAVHASDWYSVGATLHFLAHGAPPPVQTAEGSERLRFTGDRFEYRLGGIWAQGLNDIVTHLHEPDVALREIPKKAHRLRSSQPSPRWRTERLLESAAVLEIGPAAHLVISDNDYWLLPRDTDSFADTFGEWDQRDLQESGLRMSLQQCAAEIQSLLQQYLRDEDKGRGQSH